MRKHLAQEYLRPFDFEFERKLSVFGLIQIKLQIIFTIVKVASQKRGPFAKLLIWTATVKKIKDVNFLIKVYLTSFCPIM